MNFEWRRQKATANISKHGVSFEEAATVFLDPFATIFDDEWHSTYEQRELIIGYSTQNRLLIVAFTERQETIRIISARQATRQESKDYEHNVYP